VAKPKAGTSPRWMPPLLLSAVFCVLLMLAGLVPASTAAAAPAQPAAPVAAAKAPVVRQRITVTARAYGSTYATLVVYELSGKKWVKVYGPWTARVGYNGIAPPGKKREGDGRTPSGTYGFSFYFGVDSPRGLDFHFPFRHAYTYDYWDDDPASKLYNEWIDVRKQNPGADPEPMHNVPAYDYAAVIAYNTARVPGRGSAVFLHVGTGTATGGCVSLPRPELIKVLRWLRPADNPRIAIGVR
jgi:L,D-peptidoglycan transpeptidase YkuD (ErfK/YbiS/YcfS/YnhG family)